jgi:hypothetical protein
VRSARSKRTSRAPSSPTRALKISSGDLVVGDSYLGTTRLILRERKGIKPRKKDVLFYYAFVERQHFVMVRRMLLGNQGAGGTGALHTRWRA